MLKRDDGVYTLALDEENKHRGEKKLVKTRAGAELGDVEMETVDERIQSTG